MKDDHGYTQIVVDLGAVHRGTGHSAGAAVAWGAMQFFFSRFSRLV
jgi:hypothetical protein